MAYNARYIFTFESDNGTDYRIVISQRGYSGSAVNRALGRTPVLKRETGEGGICGTSLEIYAECAVDGEFADLYTSDATEFYVELQMLVSGSYATVWDGFVSPELYSEPDIAPPYDVQIIATDGLGELKLTEFAPAGRHTIWYYLKQILTLVGYNHTTALSENDYVLVNSLKAATPAVTPANLFTGLQIDPAHLEGKTNYEALEAIIGTFHIQVARYRGKWVFWRETDTDIQSAVIPAAHGSNLPSASYGTMAAFDWWPVGNTSTEIVPAKKKVVAKLPYHRRDSMLDNPHLRDITSWSTSGTVVWVDWGAGEGRPMLAALASISQGITVEATASDLALRILTGCANTEGSTSTQSYGGRWKLRIHGSADRWLKQTGDGAEWVDEETYNVFIHQVVQVESPEDWSVENFDAIDVNLPPIPVDGTLTITVDNALNGISTFIFAVGGIFLQQAEVPGYKDTVRIDNGARGEAGEKEMDFGDAPDTTNILQNFSNIITAGASTPTSAWAKGSGTSMALVRLMALDQALSVALPRLKTKGRLNVPAGNFPPFAFVSPEGLTMLPDSWSWRIVDDELDFEATSVPAASIEVQSETVTEMTPSEAASSTGGGAASGGRSSGGSGGCKYFSDYVENDVVVGAKALYDIYIVQQEADPVEETPEILKDITEILRHLSLVNTGTDEEPVWHIHADIAFASDGQITAGGYGDAGSETGGSLRDLLDVAIASLQDKQILIYDDTLQKWVNVTPVLATLSDVDTTGATNGQSLVYDSTAGKWKPATVGGGSSVEVISADATIGTSLTTLGTVNGTPIKAKIAAYLEISMFTGSNIVQALGTTPVNRATADASGNTIKAYYAANLIYDNGTLVLKNGNNNTLSTITGANILGMLGLATTDAIATQAWVQGLNYITASALNGYMLAATYTGNGTTPVNRAYGDESGNNIKATYAASMSIASSGAAKVLALWSKVANSAALATITGSDLKQVLGLGSSDTIATQADISGKIDKPASYTNGNFASFDMQGNVKDSGYSGSSFVQSVSVSDESATIGTTLTKIATVQGVDIKAKIAEYLLLSQFTASNIVSTLGTTPVNRATADASGNTITSSYLRKDTDDTMSGNLTIGSGSSNKNLTVNGNITASGQITAGSASDRRLKDHIRPMDRADAVNKIKRLNPVDFEWNEKAAELGDLSGKSRGFIADEYNNIIPNATRKIWGDFDAIDYQQAVPYLVAALQNALLRIEELEELVKGKKEGGE